MNNCKLGFSILEVLITLSLILIISSMAIPSLNFFNQQKVFCELEKLNVIFHYLQQKAITSNKTQELAFINNNSYLYSNKKETLSTNIFFEIQPNLKGSPAISTKKLKNAISFPDNKVIFYNNGLISAGSIYICDKNKDYQFALTVPISQVSFIRKYKFENGKWILI